LDRPETPSPARRALPNHPTNHGFQAVASAVY